MVNADGSGLREESHPKPVCKVCGHLTLSQYSSNEPAELS